MTTLAYKDGILAADTQLNIDENTKSLCHKIYLINEDFVFAAAGDADTTEHLAHFLAGLVRRAPSKRALKGCEGILIKEGKPYFFEASATLLAIEKAHAEGSGWRYALAAMTLGHSAVDSVKLAGELDVYTNRQVDYYDARTKELHEISFV